MPDRQDPQEQLRQCATALARDPDNPETLERMAEALLGLGQRDEAASCLRNATTLQLGRRCYREAAVLCGRLLEIDPRHREALEIVARLRRECLVAPAVLDAAIRPRHRRVTDRQPVVVAPRRFGPTAGDVDRTRETQPASRPRQADEHTSREEPDDGGFEEEPTVQDSDPRLPPPFEEPTVQDPREELPPRPRPPPRPSAPLPRLQRMPFGSSAEALLPTVTDSEVDPRVGADATAADATEVTAEAERRAPRASRQGIVLPEELLGHGSPREVARGETIFDEGDVSADLYLLQQGRVEVIKWARTPRRTRLAVLEAGACFGEQAFLGDGARHATVRALDACRLLVFGKQQLKDMMVASADVNRDVRALYRDRLQDTLVRTSPLLAALGEEEARALLRRSKPLRLSADQVVISEGTTPPGFCFVLLGQLEVTRRPKPNEEPVLLGLLADCDFFGEMSLLGSLGRPSELASATVRTRTFAQLLQLAPGELKRCAEARPDFLRALQDEAKRRERANRAILRGAARFDEQKGVVVFLPRQKD